VDRLRRLFIVCVICLAGSDARAQAPAPAPATTLTIGDLVLAAEQAATSANLATSNPQANDALTTALATLRDARVLDQKIPTFVREYTSPDAIALAHRRQHQYSPEIKTAIDTIKGVANGVLAGTGGLTPALNDAVVQLQDAEQKAGLVWDLETLRLLERKYGPGSAKLNGVEVAAAYLLQRQPVFGVDAGGRPGPFEAILAYSPSYITRSAGKMRLVGVGEVGLRQYFFRQGWGTGSGRLAWLRPGYASYGMAVTGGSDDPLRPPWQGSPRFGAFFGWGVLKAAWTGGHDQRFLVTQQFQLIPWVF
jgi:hypothetical protein